MFLNGIEIPIRVEQLSAMDDAVAGDNHVDGLAYRDAFAAQKPIVIGCRECDLSSAKANER